MDILYTSDRIPEYVKGGIIMFNMKDRVMSKIKNKVWKTLSHVGVLYQSMVSGSPTTWVTYMDEIYGIISIPLSTFIRNESIPREKGWAIRYIPNFDSNTSRILNEAIGKHSSEDSHMGMDEDNNITGSFDDELKMILGIPTEDGPKEYNTNVGFVIDILQDFWTGMQVSGEDIPKINSIGFSDDEIAKDDLVKSFYKPDDLLKSVNQLLSMVNLTPHTINAPIQPFITDPLPLFDNRLIVPSDTFYDNFGKTTVNNMYPSITEERQHVAAIIARVFESGLGNEDVREYFEEELETTTLARRGRSELNREYARDMIKASMDHLIATKNLLTKYSVSKTDRELYNMLLQDIVVAQGSLMTHHNIDDIPVKLENIML